MPSSTGTRDVGERGRAGFGSGPIERAERVDPQRAACGRKTGERRNPENDGRDGKHRRGIAGLDPDRELPQRAGANHAAAAPMTHPAAASATACLRSIRTIAAG